METSTLPITGKKITRIDISDYEITFVCGNEAFRAYHMQECCEHVMIHDISGNITDIIGCPVVSATELISDKWPCDVPPEMQGDCSFTWTTHTISTEQGTVAFRWLGESNGYYNENVYFERTHPPIPVA